MRIRIENDPSGDLWKAKVVNAETGETIFVTEMSFHISGDPSKSSLVTMTVMNVKNGRAVLPEIVGEFDADVRYAACAITCPACHVAMVLREHASGERLVVEEFAGE